MTAMHRYINDGLRIGTRSNPERGGKIVEMRTLSRTTTVMHAQGITHVVRSEYWKDIGTVMDPPTNLPVRTMSLSEKLLRDRLCHEQVRACITGGEKTGGGNPRTDTDFVVDAFGICEDVRGA